MNKFTKDADSDVGPTTVLEETRTSAPPMGYSSLRVELLGGPDPLTPLSPSARPVKPT